MSYFKTVRVQDGSGNAITSTSNALDVNLKTGGITTVTANLGTIADVATQTTLAAINTKLVTGTDIGDVTINNASGASAVNIQDGGNAITVDGTVTANIGTTNGLALDATLTGGTQQTKLTDGVDIATIRDVTGAKALDVSIVDGSGAQITSFGGGTQYTEADTDATIVGTAVMWEDAADTLRAASVAKPLPTQISDGTSVATVRNLAANDALNVSIVDGSGDQITSFGGGTQYAEDAALGATPTGTLGMARRDDALSTLTPVEDDAISLRVNSRGALWSILDANSGVDVGDVTINNASGASAVNIQDGGNSITVDMTAVVPGTAATNLGKAEDAAHASGDVGVMALSVRQAAATALAGTAGDYQPLITDGSGKLYVNPFATDATTYLPGRLTDGTTFLDPTSSTNPAIINDNWDTRADTYTVAANGTTVTMTSDPKKYYSIQAKCTTATATAWSIVLEGSLDGTNFTTIITHANADGDGTVKASTTPFPALYIRSRCASITLGSATNIVTTILGMS